MSKKLRKVTLFAFMLFFATAHETVFAGGESDADQLTSYLAELTSLQGKFSQTIFDFEGQDIQTTKGQFSLQKPSYLLWEVSPPFEQTIVSDAERLWVYDPDLEQVNVYGREKVLAGPISILNSEASELAKRYNIARTTVQANQLEIYKLVPTDTGESFASLELEIIDGQLNALRMYDHLQQKTEIVFSETITNEDIEPSRFQFTLPPGVDVILDE